jgi:hypothetical protein
MADRRDQLKVTHHSKQAPARLSVRQVMINGNALSPPLSFVAAIPVASNRGH